MPHASPLTGAEIKDTDQALRAALRAAMRDAKAESDSGYDWLSPRFSKVKFIPIDLLEVCGGSGWYGRPKREVSR